MEKNYEIDTSCGISSLQSLLNLIKIANLLYSLMFGRGGPHENQKNFRTWI